MRLKFINYYGKNKIVSIAISQQVREDLEKDKLDYIYVQNNKFFYVPMDWKWNWIVIKKTSNLHLN